MWRCDLANPVLGRKGKKTLGAHWPCMNSNPMMRFRFSESMWLKELKLSKLEEDIWHQLCTSMCTHMNMYTNDFKNMTHLPLFTFPLSKSIWNQTNKFLLGYSLEIFIKYCVGYRYLAVLVFNRELPDFVC